MERIFEETANRHFYTNDYENSSEKGNTVSVDVAAIVSEDAVSYVIKKYNLQTL